MIAGAGSRLTACAEWTCADVIRPGVGGGPELLSEAAETQPLLCLIDDAQWLDRPSAKAFAFAVRRLLAESVATVFAAREPIEELGGGAREL